MNFETNVDFLRGNICRLVVTDDIEELAAMYAWACRRLNEIYFEKRKRSEDGKKEGRA